MTGPIDPENGEVFQMDIQRTASGEFFRIWPGALDNEIDLLDWDRGYRQVVLRVQEPRRMFVRRVSKSRRITRAQVEAEARSHGGRILDELRHSWVVELWTPGEERRFLCGKDDLHFFAVQIWEGSTVEEAHESLRPQEVREALGRNSGPVLRQGEWFFLPLETENRGAIDEHFRTSPRPVFRDAPVGDGNQPHVASEVVEIRSRSLVFARGHVAHRDHRTLWIEDWRRVVRNRSVPIPRGQVLRLRWID
jgi:hypothetical protein